MATSIPPHNLGEVCDAVVDKVRGAFSHLGPSEVIFTNLTSEQESALREAFSAG